MALALHQPVSVLQQTISSEEFTLWQAYHRLSPITQERAEHRSALIAYTIACAHSGKGKKPKFDDFVLTYGPKRRITDPRAIMATLNQFARASRRGNHRNTVNPASGDHD